MSVISTIAQALVAAPPTPACFPDRLQWAAYLLACQQNKQKPFKAGIYRTDFSHCDDCTLAHATHMARLDKCNPSQFRAALIQKEVSHEAM